MVRARMERAADRARRDPSEVTLLAVTKVFPASAIRDAYALGLREFGENYVQEFEGKAPEVADLKDARFHLIGHLPGHLSGHLSVLIGERFGILESDHHYLVPGGTGHERLR